MLARLVRSIARWNRRGLVATAGAVWCLQARRKAGSDKEREAHSLGLAELVKLERRRRDDASDPQIWMPYNPPRI